MILTDALNYVLFTNPISATTLDISKGALNSLIYNTGIRSQNVVNMAPSEPLWKLARANGPIIQIAAVSGALATILGAYGSHRSYPEEKEAELKRVLDTASRYHFIHTITLIVTPLTRMPLLPSSFFLSGLLLFCGPCYYYAFTGNPEYSKLTPIGGTCFILGWLGMII